MFRNERHDLDRHLAPKSCAGLAVLALLLASCGGGGSSSSPSVPPTTSPQVPTPAPSTVPTTAPSTSPAAFICPTSDQAASVASMPQSVTRSTEGVGRMMGLRTSRPASSTATGLLAVTYNAAAVSGTSATMTAAREHTAGANMVQQLTFSRTGKVVRIVSVSPAQMTTVASTLRMQAGVENVSPAGQLRYPVGVTTPYYPSDPYFNGFTAAQNNTAGNTAPSTYHVSPYAGSASVPGQWDMHAIGLEKAFGYSQPANGSTIVNANAIGSSGVKIAIIDTGADTTHPELTAKVVYQKCYITNTSNVQSTSNFVTDPQGHGTDVSGLAAEATNNGFGFTGAGGNSVLYEYRVFPTPDDNCVNDNTTDAQCGSNTVDIASAIVDAVKQNVNVISLSLGGSNSAGVGCPGGQDNDSIEGAAVAEAIAANIVVVAASGNSGAASVIAPACDPGVIAAGATSLADGSPNGSNVSGGSAAAPFEYVASYSNFGSPASSIRNASAWGIVAPGGDPATSGDTDYLHWIENIWTSKPYQSSPSDKNFIGECTDDYPNSTGTTAPVDCRTLIAGTSMSTPHVAGAAALLIAVNPAYQSPSAMKSLICSTADNIGGNQGCGRLNVYNAMAKALGDPSPPAPMP